MIQPALLVDLQGLLLGWRKYLQERESLWLETYDENRLHLGNTRVIYTGAGSQVSAAAVIYANGQSASQSRFWRQLPFSPNKGEALIVDIPNLPRQHIYKFGITTLVPWRQGKWWAGSTYDHRFTDSQPTEQFRRSMEIFFQQVLRVPWQIVSHIAALRPASLDRRPFVGMHPRHRQVGIFNGMGTKGVSLAPWFGRQLASHLLQGHPHDPAVDVARFKKAFQ